MTPLLSWLPSKGVLDGGENVHTIHWPCYLVANPWTDLFAMTVKTGTSAHTWQTSEEIQAKRQWIKWSEIQVGTHTIDRKQTSTSEHKQAIMTWSTKNKQEARQEEVQTRRQDDIQKDRQKRRHTDRKTDTDRQTVFNTWVSPCVQPCCWDRPGSQTSYWQQGLCHVASLAPSNTALLLPSPALPPDNNIPIQH